MNTGIKLLVIFLILTEGSWSLRIGAFNLKVFGRKKADNEQVLGYIVEIIKRYDIIFLQEIRDSSGDSITVLENALNRSPGSKYDKIVSKRLGSTTSKEQYIFLYRRHSGITIVSSYVYHDPQNEFEREPYIVKIQSTKTVLSEFVLAGIHVKPLQAIQEITALETVHSDIVSKMKTEEILFLGDMNAECSYAPKKYLNDIPIRKSDKYHWLISDNIDTTVSKGTDCAYDRFILHGDKFWFAIVEGSSNIFEFDKEYRLTNTVALSVSDHYPIELEMKTVTSSAPYIPFTMFTTVCFGSVICSCIYCLRG